MPTNKKLIESWSFQPQTKTATIKTSFQKVIQDWQAYSSVPTLTAVKAIKKFKIWLALQTDSDYSLS